MTDPGLELTELTAARLVEGYRKGEFSPEEVTRAALDVFEHEPLGPDSPLWQVPDLIVSPHMSGDTVGWRDELGSQFLELYDRWAAGKPLLNVVDKKRGYVPGH